MDENKTPEILKNKKYIYIFFFVLFIAVIAGLFAVIAGKPFEGININAEKKQQPNSGQLPEEIDDLQEDLVELESQPAGSIAPTAESDIKAGLIFDRDQDGDGLTDEQEMRIGTDRKFFDSDNDGLSDYKEVVIYKTDPLKSDTDGDGFSDGKEVEAGRNPLK